MIFFYIVLLFLSFNTIIDRNKFFNVLKLYEAFVQYKIGKNSLTAQLSILKKCFIFVSTVISIKNSDTVKSLCFID